MPAGLAAAELACAAGFRGWAEPALCCAPSGSCAFALGRRRRASPPAAAQRAAPRGGRRAPGGLLVAGHLEAVITGFASADKDSPEAALVSRMFNSAFAPIAMFDRWARMAAANATAEAATTNGTTAYGFAFNNSFELLFLSDSESF